MVRYRSLVNFSYRNLGPAEIANYFNDTDSAIRQYYTTRSARKFFAYTLTEAVEEMEARVAELDATCTFTLLADLEATFKIDYLQRCYMKKKDRISKNFRKTYAEKKASVSLDRDLLPIWRDHHPKLKGIIGAINGAFNYRDWIAHGRYWTPSLGQRYDFVTVFQIDEAVRRHFPFIPA